MRSLLTAILFLILLPTFVAFFALSSVISYTESPEQLLEYAEKENLHADVVEAAAKMLMSHRSMVRMPEDQVRALAAIAISKEWLKQSLTTAHGAVANALKGAEEGAVLDLRDLKTALFQSLVRLREDTEKNCEAILGEQTCADSAQVQLTVLQFEFQVSDQIRKIPNQIDLLKDLRGRDGNRADELQEKLDGLHTLRLLAMIALVVLLALIVVINLVPLRRLLFSSGLILIALSVSYMVVAALLSELAADQVAEQVAGRQLGNMQELGETLARGITESIFGGFQMTVIGLGILGVFSVAASAALTLLSSRD